MREGWKETTLGEVAEVLDRFRKPVNATEREQRLGSVPYYGATGRTGWIDEPLFNEELVLLGEDAIDFLNPTATKAYRIVGPAWVNNHAHVLRPIVSKILGMLLVELLNAVDYSQFTSYGTRSKLTQGSMMQITFLLPPLAEQKRIVDVIGAVDAYVASLESYAHAARTARAALLHELLTTNTQGWKQTTLGEVMTVEGSRIDPSTISDTTPYIGLEHLETDAARIGKHGAPSQVSSAVAPFVNGDVLFGRLRPYLRKVALATEAGVASPELLVLRPTEECLPSFLLYLCSRPATIEACVAMSAGSRMPRTSATDLASIQIPLPPLAEQQRIVDVIGSVDGAIAGADRAAEDARSLRSGLLSDLLSGDHAIPESYDRLLGAA